MLFELISGHTVAGNNELIKNTGGGLLMWLQLYVWYTVRQTGHYSDDTQLASCEVTAVKQTGRMMACLNY